MMWIVKVALRAPYTFTVTGLLILIGGVLSGLQMAKDIFPAINIPVVGVIWMYNGLPAVKVDEYPNETFAGKVARDAGAFDQASRTILLELDVPNPDGRL
jgi:hypothetical protein